MNEKGELSTSAMFVIACSIALLLVAASIYAHEKPIQVRENTLPSVDGIADNATTVDIELNGSVSLNSRIETDIVYLVAVQINKLAPGTFIFDKIKARFILGKEILEIDKTPTEGDEWVYESGDNYIFLFKSIGITAKFIDLARNSSQKNIEFSVILENDGRPITRTSTAIIPTYNELRKNGISNLEFSPKILTVRTTSV